jgi:hypothetical protein
MLWEVDIYPAPGQPDLLGRPVAAAAAELGLAADLKVLAARGYLIQADWDRCPAERVALELLTDRVVERVVVAEVGEEELNRLPDGGEDVGWDQRAPASAGPPFSSPVLAGVDYEQTNRYPSLHGQ